MRFLTFATLLLLSSCALPLHAAVGDDFDITLDTDNLTPYSTVILTPESTSLDLSRAVITARAGGKVIYEGSGGAGIPVTLGGAGAATTVSVTVAVDGTTLEKSLTLRPQEVLLIVEPVSTTHPFYEGAGLVSAEAPVRIIALADLRDGSGKRAAPSTLSYTWKFGNQVLSAQSGIGKNVLSATAPLKYRDAQISVTITTVDQSLFGGATTRISVSDPLLRVYRNNPLLGPDFDTALLGTAAMQDDEETFRVVPYFFPSAPAIVWKVNSVESGKDKDLTVRSTGSGAGSANIGVAASIPSVFLTASQNLTLSFGANKSFNIFGL